MCRFIQGLYAPWEKELMDFYETHPPRKVDFSRYSISSVCLWDSGVEGVSCRLRISASAVMGFAVLKECDSLSCSLSVL